jgi:CheY-like chemotaxis protein
LLEERGEDVKKILVVEDNRMMGVLVSKRLQQEAIYDVTWVQTMKDAVDLLQTEKDNFFAALLDYNLPDAPKGEIVPLCFQAFLMRRFGSMSGRIKLWITSSRKTPRA